MRNFWIFLFVFPCLFGCQETKVGNTEAISQLPATFYKRLEGIKDGKPIQIQLTKSETDWQGVYVTDQGSRSLMLDTVRNDTVVFWDNGLTDYYQGKKASNKLSLRWNGAGFDAEYLETGKPTLKFTLNETYPVGSEKLKYIAYRDSTPAFPRVERAPKAEFTVNSLRAANKWLDARLQLSIGIQQNSVTWNDGLRILKTKYFDEYRKGVSEILPFRADSMNAALNQFERADMQVQYNDKGYLVVDLFRSNYTGGAHGYYFSTMINLDVKNQSVLKLSDIIQADSNTVKGLLEKYFRIQYKLKPNAKLTQIIFDPTLKMSENFYFNQNGLCFIYNPYEIASYAQGQIVVFIPSEALKPYLVHDFASRMQW